MPLVDGDKKIIREALVEVLRDNTDMSRIPWWSTGQTERMVSRGQPATGLPMRAHLAYGYEHSINLTVAAKLDEILAAALDDGNVDVTASPEMIAMIKALTDDLKAETRDAVADLGEGGSQQVRADED